MKPVIAIVSNFASASGNTWGNTIVSNAYIISITKAGGIPVILPSLKAEADMDTYLRLCDGFLFTGGADISPSLFGEEPHPKLGATNLQLDQTLLSLMRNVLNVQKPVLAICRGAQVLNIAAGGTVYQDLSEKETPSFKHMQDSPYGDIHHKIYIDSPSLLHSLLGEITYVNSYHHQAVKDPGANVRIVARSADQVVEAIELQDYGYGLGLQWHPEVLFAYGNERMRPIFASFIKACKKE